MAKQSPKDPKFRCNICKEYYHAPEHPVHYQCAIHGYLCEKHIGKEEDIIYCHTFDRKIDEEFSNRFWIATEARRNAALNKLPIPELPPVQPIPDSKLKLSEDPYYDKKYPLPTELVAKCMCHYKEQVHYFPYFAKRVMNKDKEYYGYKVQKNYFGKTFIDFLNTNIKDSGIKSNDSEYSTYAQCLKVPIKYIWNDNAKRWLEVGKDKEEDFIKDVKVKSNQKAGNPEVKLLVDLFEKNVLTKDQFLIQLKEILKF